MFGNKIILNSRCLLSRNVLPLGKIGESLRGAHIVHVPPRNKASIGTVIAYGVVLAFSMYSIPAWVLYHLPDYQKEDRNSYTGK